MEEERGEEKKRRREEKMRLRTLLAIGKWQLAKLRVEEKSEKKQNQLRSASPSEMGPL